MIELILSVLIGIPLLNLVIYIIRFEATEISDWRYMASRNYQDKRFWEITPATRTKNAIYRKTQRFDKVRPTLADFFGYIREREWFGTIGGTWAWPIISIAVLIWQVFRCVLEPLYYAGCWVCEMIGKIRI